MTTLGSRYLIFAFVAVLFAGFISSCDSSKDFPDEPVINSLEFDSVNKALIINFTDGDGDFGIDNDAPPFQQYLDADSTIPNPYYYNLWLDYYEKRNGEWVLVETPSTFNFRIPVLTPAGQNKQLDVKITYDMDFDLPLPNAESDTIKFGVTLVDRAKNQSIPKETLPIILAN